MEAQRTSPDGEHVDLADLADTVAAKERGKVTLVATHRDTFHVQADSFIDGLRAARKAGYYCDGIAPQADGSVVAMFTSE